MKKKIFSLAIILAMLCTNNIFAQETVTRSIEEIKAEIEQVRQELHTATIKNSITQYSADKLTLEEKIAKESATLPIKNKLADLEYDLAIAEGRVIKLDDIKKSLENPGYETRVIDANFKFQAGDIILFSNHPDGDDPSLFDWITYGYQHVAFVVNGRTVAEAPGKGKISVLRNISELFTDDKVSRYRKVFVKRMNLSNSERISMQEYVSYNLINKTYAILPYGKWQTTYIYCSLIPWLVFKNSIRFIDIDYDGGAIVFPSDILLNNYGELFAVVR